MDLQGRSTCDYDGAWKKPDFSMRKLSNGVTNQGKQRAREGLGDIYKHDTTEGNTFDASKAA